MAMVLIVLLTIALALVSLREKHISRSMLIEKGVFVALVGAITMGTAQFFMGWSARIVDPIAINFITDVFMMSGTAIYLIFKGRMTKTFTDFRSHARMILPMSVFDKMAWVAYAFSMTLAPISIATALAESYIIAAVLLGVFVNKEKLLAHQKVGMAIAILSAIILACITNY